MRYASDVNLRLFQPPLMRRYETEEARKSLVQDLHLLKTQLFMDTIEAGKVPLRPGVLRVVDEAIKAGVPLVSRKKRDGGGGIKESGLH